MYENDVEAVDMALESALATIDRATLALHLCRNAATSSQRTKFGQHALHYFDAALAELDGVEGEVRATVSWRVWRDEAQKGIASARKILDPWKGR